MHYFSGAPTSDPQDQIVFVRVFFLNESTPRVWAFGPDPRRWLEYQYEEESEDEMNSFGKQQFEKESLTQR